MLHFLKKIKKNTWRYHYFTPVYQKLWWYDPQFLQYRAWQTETGNLRSSFALLPPPPNDLKNQYFEKMKKKHQVYQKSWYATLFLFPRYNAWQINFYFSYWAIFCPFTPPNPPNNTENQNFKVMKKNSWRYHHFTHDQMMYGSWDIVCDRSTNKQMDGQKNWHIEVGAPPTKKEEADIRILLYAKNISQPISNIVTLTLDADELLTAISVSTEQLLWWFDVIELAAQSSHWMPHHIYLLR